MSDYLKRLRKLSKNKQNVQSSASFIKAIDYIDRLEDQLEIKQHAEYSACVDHSGPISFKQDEIFFDDIGDRWKIIASTRIFVIATRCGIDRNKISHNDIMHLSKPL